MKKSLLLAMLGLTAAAASVSAQGVIFMDNALTTSGPYVRYGTPGIPANGVSGSSGFVNTGLLNGWTAGLYYAVGNVTNSVAFDPSGFADPAALGGGLALGTGSGSTVLFFTSSAGSPGGFTSAFTFPVPGTSSVGGDTVTIMLIAYNTSAGSYANAQWRGHSAPFVMTTSSSSSPSPNPVGAFMSGFSVFAVPEPSTMALAGISGLALLLHRRRKT